MTRRALPCRECGIVAGVQREGDYSMCANCGGDRHRWRLTIELSTAIDAYHDGTVDADAVVAESFNQEFKGITEQM